MGAQLFVKGCEDRQSQALSLVSRLPWICKNPREGEMKKT